MSGMGCLTLTGLIGCICLEFAISEFYFFGLLPEPIPFSKISPSLGDIGFGGGELGLKGFDGFWLRLAISLFIF